MRLRNDYLTINYPVGNLVRIIPNLREQEEINLRRGNGRLSAGLGGDSMLNLQNSLARITRILNNNRYEIDRDIRNVYSADMFTTSYTFDEDESDVTTEDRPFLSDLIYDGMYLFSNRNDEAGARQELFKVQITPRSTRENTIEGIYIRYNDKFSRAVDESQLMSQWVTNDITWMRYGRQFRYASLIRMFDGKQFVGTDLYIPNNEVLMERFGVTNRITETETKKLEGHLDLPNIFEGYKYPVVQVAFTENGYYGVHKEYGFKISNKILVTYDGKSKITKKIDNILGESNVIKNEKLLKDLILKWGKATVKSYGKSVELFGHKTRKKAMFEATDDKGKQKVFKITSVKFNYDKEGNFHHVIELNDGTLNLKFLLDDINLVLPTINDYVAPKDRTIKANDECKLVNNKITPVQKGSTVKVLKMFNRHQVHNPRLGVYDKNTVALVLDKTSNKQFECKIKQLKKI